MQDFQNFLIVVFVQSHIIDDINAFNPMSSKRTIQNADDNIEYENQFPLNDDSGCGVSNHCGTATRNSNEWTPPLRESVNENKKEGGTKR